MGHEEHRKESVRVSNNNTRFSIQGKKDTSRVSNNNTGFSIQVPWTKGNSEPQIWALRNSQEFPAKT
jgi:hypothetical protein